MFVQDQDRLLRWTLDLLDGSDSPCPLVDLATDRFARAGFASGLTAVIGAASADLGVGLPDPFAGYVADQRAELRRRHERFAEIIPRVLTVLGEAGVDAIPVKGAVLTAGLWPFCDARPMSDIDLLVAPTQRNQAAAACLRAGWPLAERNAWEDTFLAWGDGQAGRGDGESAEHSGKVELHPGWVERLHGYLIDDNGVVTGSAVPGRLAGVRCQRLPAPAFAAHVLGHLSATVIRAEVRPVHVVDAVVVLQALVDVERADLLTLIDALDPRLTAPGLWLVGKYRPAAIPDGCAERANARLSVRAADHLGRATPSMVLRGADSRTSWAWRSSFTTSLAEQSAALRQMVWPATADLQRGGDRRSPWRLQSERVSRGARRLLVNARARR